MSLPEAIILARLVALQQRSIALLGDGTRLPPEVTGLIRDCRGVGRAVRKTPRAALDELERLEGEYHRIAEGLPQD
jgi:hypothetical protein